MAALVQSDRHILNRKYPTLANFPFTEFELEVGQLPSAPSIMKSVDGDEPKQSKYDSPIIKFTTDKIAKFSINIHEKDMLWIFERAETVTDLDDIANSINSALESSDLLFRRDAVEKADDWINTLSDKRTMLTYSTFTEVLVALIGETTLVDATRLINNINKLANKVGIVKLSKDEYQVVTTYYEFRLIYTKLILGLVIASKISI